MERKLISVDLDQTLTNEGRFWVEEKITPNQEMIEKVNQEYKKGNIIIIHTSRPSDYARKTHAWLIENGVMFHGIRFEKMSADVYLDDKALNIKDF